jgi:hypothetical protein
VTPPSIRTITPAASQCEGDCDGDVVVTVTELIGGVAIALGQADPSSCLALDGDGNRAVTIDELLLAVARALHGCPVQDTATELSRL